MLVEEVAALFRQWAQEDDETYMSKADVAVYLRLGYRRFRQLVTRIKPDFYDTTVTLTFAASREYNLQTGAVKILGLLPGALTDPRLASLKVVEKVDSSGRWLDDVRIAADFEELHDHDQAALLNGVTLYLAWDHSGDLRLRYVPVESVDWSLNEPGDADTHIDDAEEHHALIATYAYGFYAPRDFSENPFLMGLQEQQEKDLRAFLYNWVRQASDHIPIRR